MHLLARCSFWSIDASTQRVAREKPITGIPAELANFRSS